MDLIAIKTFLDNKVAEYERIEFIELDPISVPHRYNKLQDIEISAFIAATLAWGNRASIIKSANQFLAFMDNAPHEFVMHHSAEELKGIGRFVHRTFNGMDAQYFVQRLRHIYLQHESLEYAFFPREGMDVQAGLAHFHSTFFEGVSTDFRTRKHISTPVKKSACKRLNMFLRWMVRQHSEVDFGLWQRILPAQLMIPLDVHCGTIARRMGLLSRKQNDWQAVIALTELLKTWDLEDPVKYDYALFSLGVLEQRLDM